jgi:hypothetical protein
LSLYDGLSQIFVSGEGRKGERAQRDCIVRNKLMRTLSTHLGKGEGYGMSSENVKNFKPGYYAPSYFPQ